jgi:class 3 adenylate cyclase
MTTLAPSLLDATSGGAAALAAASTQLEAALRRVKVLESIQSGLLKFVPRAVQDLIRQAPEAPDFGMHEANISVLFADIVGYTRLSERLAPARLNALVERYFGAFLDEIGDQGGDVSGTAGDGLMVVFQDADPRRHARAATLSALRILERAREMNAERASAEEAIALHIGVNSGSTAVGVTRIEGRAATRWTYTASGLVTCIAARLAQLGHDGVIAGPTTAAALGGDFRIEPLGERLLKNVERPLPVYRVIGTAA